MNTENTGFKGLPDQEPAPDHIKREVVASVRVARLLMDFSELFTARVGQTLGGLFKDEDNHSDEEPTESEQQ